MVETGISLKLRMAADSLHITPRPMADVIVLLREAADEADRFNDGMRAWKQTAETKDAKLSAEMTDRINERVAERLANERFDELRTMRAAVPARPILYTDTISGDQCRRDDMWAVTTEELNRLAAAPDLLAALRELTNDITERFDMGSRSTNLGMKNAVAQALAAIAKATSIP